MIKLRHFYYSYDHKRRKYPDDLVKSVNDLYMSGLSISKVATKLNLTFSIVHSIMKKNHIVARPAAGCKKPDPDKFCAFCENKLYRRINTTGEYEDRVAFIKRKFCNYECYFKSLAVEYPTHRSTSYRYYIKYKKTKCEFCKSKKKLHVHHIDENMSNNNEKNLQTLCQDCHIDVHKQLRKLKRIKNESSKY